MFLTKNDVSLLLLFLHTCQYLISINLKELVCAEALMRP